MTQFFFSTESQFRNLNFQNADLCGGANRLLSASVPRVWAYCRIRCMPETVHMKKQDYISKQGKGGAICA